jgi:hypothetical protein
MRNAKSKEIFTLLTNNSFYINSLVLWIYIRPSMLNVVRFLQ